MTCFRFIAAGVTVAATLGLTARPAAAAHVDFFDAGAFSLEADPGEVARPATADQSGLPTGAGGVLGGTRFVGLHNESDDGTLTAELDEVGDGEGDLSFVSGGQPGFLGTLQFGYFSFDDADLLNKPNGRQWTRLQVTFTNVEAAGQVTAHLGSSEQAASQASVTRNYGDAVEGRLDFDYSAFLTDNPDLDLTDIEHVGLSFDLVADSRAEVSFFGRGGDAGDPNVIPTPAALPAGLALLGGALGGVVVRRRRLRG